MSFIPSDDAISFCFFVDNSVISVIRGCCILLGIAIRAHLLDQIRPTRTRDATEVSGCGGSGVGGVVGDFSAVFQSSGDPRRIAGRTPPSRTLPILLSNNFALIDCLSLRSMKLTRCWEWMPRMTLLLYLTLPGPDQILISLPSLLPSL